ncbi:MAG: hypothetical protein IJ673_09445, partial [Treponema sp.]|nr:hypothetical protein [Treponema sp.]
TYCDKKRLSQRDSISFERSISGAEGVSPEKRREYKSLNDFTENSREAFFPTKDLASIPPAFAYT